MNTILNRKSIHNNDRSAFVSGLSRTLFSYQPGRVRHPRHVNVRCNQWRASGRFRALRGLRWLCPGLRLALQCAWPLPGRFLSSFFCIFLPSRFENAVLVNRALICHFCYFGVTLRNFAKIPVLVASELAPLVSCDGKHSNVDEYLVHLLEKKWEFPG